MGNHLSKKLHVLRKIKSTGYIDTLSTYHFVEKEYFDEREHSIHAMGRELFKNNFCSPVQDILSDSNSIILDVGCGPGFWLMEMAADFPKPSYVGVDIAPVFPNFTPPDNVKFIQHDFLRGLPYKDNTFDFIYIRSLSYDFTEKQWETFIYQELARLLKPGGWLEVRDYDMNTVNVGPTINRINQAIRDNLLSNNISPYIIQRHASLIKSIPSFSSSIVHQETKALHFGSSDSNENELGRFCARLSLENCRFILQGPIGQSLKIKQKNIESTLDAIKHEYDTYRPYCNVYGFYVQKMKW